MYVGQFCERKYVIPIFSSDNVICVYRAAVTPQLSADIDSSGGVTVTNEFARAKNENP